MYVGMYVCRYVCMYVGMYVGRWVCTYVGKYVSMCEYPYQKPHCS